MDILNGLNIDWYTNCVMGTAAKELQNITG
jgi:hypothetical protein